MSAPVLPKSAAPNYWLSATTAGETLRGSDAHRNQLAANAVNVTLVGGARDDTYIAFDSLTRITELAGGGTDTVMTWGNGYTLGNHVENLTLMGSANSTATGNAGNNLIIGNDGDNRIVTGGGNDVLVGSKGADTYVPTKSAGSITWITGFKSSGPTQDKIDLRGFGIDGFAGIQSRMKQVGKDLRIDLGNGQQVMLENKTKADVTAANFQVEASVSNMLGLSNLVLTFSEEFNALNLYSAWQPFDGWGNRNLHGNQELQLNVDPQFRGLGINPFSVKNGVLTITAAKAQASVRPKIGDHRYTSGMLSSHDFFTQQYGYFEIRAQMTDQQGMWPAFWMLSANGTWPPELDVAEMVGKHPYSVVQTAHTKTGPALSKLTTSPTNLADGFHTYGMNWTAKTITFYFDGQATHQIATPADMHSPMYMMVNLAVGGTWPGSPDSTTDWSKTNIKVDYIRAYKHGDAASTTLTAGLKAVISNAMDAQNLNSSFTTVVTGPGTSTTYSAGQLRIAGIDPGASVIAAYDTGNAFTVTNTGAWNAIKNARVESVSSGTVTVDNFVDTRVLLGDEDNTVTVTSAKRGSITTGAGDDRITVAGFSNDSNGNTMAIDAGGGDNTVSFSGASNTRATIATGSGDDRITISGQARGTVAAGAGNDRIVIATSGAVTASGGAGRDVFEFIRSAHATISDFNASEDRIVVRGGSDNGVQVRAGSGYTVIDLGNGGSAVLSGVTVPTTEIKISYA